MPASPYVPRHAAVPVRATGRTRGESADAVVKAPGLAAMLRRSPHRVRQAAVAVIATGLVLFVVTNVASAAPHRTSRATHDHHLAAPAAPIASSTAAPAPAPVAHRPNRAPAAPAAPTHRRAHVAARELAAKPVKAKQKAPATRQVISGLAANGIPNVAMNAYRVAATRMRHDLPSCGIDWALLAGIGREESDHGQFAGAVLHPNGTSTPRVVGPALDGTSAQYIPAPANGAALDGDATYTHALGPMQFIPQTWARYGTDATGDGRADIFNINDAALSAARYLCAAGGNLRTQAGQVRAVLAYNHSDQYLAQVLALAQAYRSGLKVTGIPVGILKGSLPPIKSGLPVAVNPGAPTAVGGAGGSKHGSHGSKRRSGRSHAPSTPKSSHPGSSAPRPKSSAPASPKSKPSTPRSSTPKSKSPGSGSSSSPPGGTGGGKGGGGSSPSPTPTPSPTCKVGIGGVCVVH